MRKWLIRGSLTMLVGVLTMGFLYEYPSHVARGWLRGEAFYDGRPTSYWRGRIDAWLIRFDNPEDAARGITLQGGRDPLLDSRKIFPRPRAATTWTRFADCFRTDLERQREEFALPPRVLVGCIEAEPVLLELPRAENYHLLTARALHNAAYYKEQEAKESSP